MSKSKGWPEIGLVTVNEGEKDGKKYKISSIKLNDNVAIFVDGEEIELNQYRTLDLITPVQEVQNLIKAGVIKEEDQERRKEAASNAPKWLKYKIIARPPRK